MNLSMQLSAAPGTSAVHSCVVLVCALGLQLTEYIKQCAIA